MSGANSFPILMAEDDADDRFMAEEAFQEARVANPLVFVQDGQMLLDYLQHRNGYNSTNAPRPGLILLDLNMPRKDGRVALAEIKAHPQLKSIPVVVLTTSTAETDVSETYDLGASGYISKPVSFGGLLEAVRLIKNYWVELVTVPTGH